MEKKYLILWVDDQCNDNEMIQFKIEAENEGVILEGYTSFEEAFEVLENKIEHFDGILLDGMFFENKDQVVGTEDELGIGAAIAKINELKSKKVFAWFVLSGKDQFTKNKNSIIEANKKRCFDKTNPSDIVELFREIKIAANKQPETQIRHKYKRVFDVCTDKYIGKDTELVLLDALKIIENDSVIINTENLFNSIRKIIEKLFATFNKLKLLPDEVYRKGSINQSSLYLSSNNKSYTIKSEILHPTIAFLLWNILKVIQDASHNNDNLTLKIDQHVREINTPYLYKSVVYQLLDILIWFKKHADENPDKEKNKLLWEYISEGEWIRGKVIRIAENGYGTFEPLSGGEKLTIIPIKVKEFRLNVQQMIEVITKQDIKGKTLIENIRV